jgi:hypothetical protein
MRIGVVTGEFTFYNTGKRDNYPDYNVEHAKYEYLSRG